jgi:hypothetical protein
MKKYNEEIFSVINSNTGKKIVDCADEQDALMMVSFDPQNRAITKNKNLMGPVVDIEIPKQLPTSEVVVGAVGSDYKPEPPAGSNGPGEPQSLPQIRLPERQAIPVNAK